jgi:ABC-type Mn2+/Zn2+ transport system ATPase subunit
MRDVAIRLAAGEILALTGANGSGKWRPETSSLFLVEWRP